MAAQRELETMEWENIIVEKGNEEAPKKRARTVTNATTSAKCQATESKSTRKQ